jgi:hypothetical protein
MEKEFVPYEQVSSLIALGFNEPVIAHRQNGLDICLLKEPKVLLTDLSMILYQQAFRWFREKHGLGHMINGIGYESFIMNIGGVLHILNALEFKTYEEAELACLNKLIKIVESKKE